MCVHWYFAEHYSELSYCFLLNSKGCIFNELRASFKNELSRSKKIFTVNILNKNTVMTETIKLMYFWWNHFDKNNHFEKIFVAVKNMDYLFLMASELLESKKLHLLFLSDVTQIDVYKYFELLNLASIWR